MIRRFAAPDAEAVAAMVAALNAEEGYDSATAADAAQLCDTFLGARALGALLVAGDPARGYCTLHPSYETEFAARGAHMGDLYVAPPARRQGVGRALVAAAAAHVRAEWHGAFLWWTALTKNAAGHAFYAALGAEGEPVRVFALTGAAFARLADRA